MHTAYKVSTIVIPAVNAAAAIHVVAGYIEQIKDTKNDSQSVNNRSKIQFTGTFLAIYLEKESTSKIIRVIIQKAIAKAQYSWISSFQPGTSLTAKTIAAVRVN